jgi:hypothetical protein
VLKKNFILAIAIQSSLTAAPLITFSAVTSIHRNANEDVLNPQLALHPTNFSAIVVWVSSVSGSYQMQGSSFNGSIWSTPTVLGASETQPSPKIKIDANGIGIAVWDSFDGVNLTLQTARFDAMGWGVGTTLVNLGTMEYNPLANIAMNKRGVAVTTWLSPTFHLIGSTYNPDSMTWSSPYPVSESGTPLSTTVTAPTSLDSDNRLTAILPLSSRLDTVVIDALNPPATPVQSFLRLLRAQVMTSSISQPNVNDLTAFFIQDTMSDYLISATRVGTAPWNFLLPGHPGSAAANLSFALNPLNNRLGIAWELTNGAIQAGFYNFVSWQFVTSLSTLGSSPAATFYQGTSDRFVVIWDDQTGGDGNHAIYFSEYDAATRLWSDPSPISQTSVFTGSTQLASLPNGMAIAVWTRTDPTVGPTPRKILEAALGSP